MANQDLTVGNPGMIIRRYCLPLFGSVFFQQMYNLADSFVAGRFIGENALAAVGNGYEITLIYLAFAFGCNTGCSVNTAWDFGAKNYKDVRTAISTSLIATAAICFLLTVSGLILTKPLLRLIRTPDSIFIDSTFVIAKKVKKLPVKKAPLITRCSLKDFFLVAVPSTSQRGIVVIGNMIIQGVVNSYGVTVTTGYAVAVKLINLSTSFFGTIGTGVTNYTAQNLGAGSPQRVREGFKASVKFVWVIALVTYLLCEFFPDALVRIFLLEPTDAVQKVAIDFLRIASPFYFAPAIKIMCDSVLCGAKKMGLVIFSLALDLGLRALAAVLCSALFHTAFSIWFAWPVGWVIAAGITLVLYQYGLSESIKQVKTQSNEKELSDSG